MSGSSIATPPGGDTSPSQGYPSSMSHGPIYILESRGERFEPETSSSGVRVVNRSATHASTRLMMRASQGEKVCFPC